MSEQAIINELKSIRGRVDGLIEVLEDRGTVKPEWMPSCIDSNGLTVPIPQEWLTAWEMTYPRGFVLGCIREAALWSLDNQSKRKKDIRRFIGSWIRRKAQDQGVLSAQADNSFGSYERMHGDD